VKVVALWSLIASGMVKKEEEELMFAVPLPITDIVMCLWPISFLYNIPCH
jgi:hypothetical protein